MEILGLPSYIFFDYVAALIFVTFMSIFIYRRRKNVKVQKLLSIGKVPLIFMVMLHTTWGLKWMRGLANRYRTAIQWFGYISVVISTAAMGLAIYIMGLIFVKLFTDPIQASVAPALPFMELPVIGYLSFSHWILVLGFIATIHEFAHGVVSEAFKVKVKSSGIAILNLFLPIIPAAFVEPDEKGLRKNPRAFYTTIAAGPAINIISAVVLWAILVFAIVPIENEIIQVDGMVFTPVDETTPVGKAGFGPDILITSFQGSQDDLGQRFYDSLQNYTQPKELTFSGINTTSQEPFTATILPVWREDDMNTGYVGAFVSLTTSFKDYVWYGAFFAWFKRLILLAMLFSLFVGIINMAPILIADGGQIFAYFLEKRKKGLGMKVTGYLTFLIVGILIAGMISWAYFTITGGFA